jgi:protein-tyrosine phosphatase
VGHRLVVDSAGTTGHHVGEPPDLRAQRHALRRGVDLSTQRARQVISSDFEHFDHVLAMDRSHLQALKRQAGPGAAGRIRLLMDFAGGAPGRDVPDPYYGGADGFEQVLDLVEQGCRGLLLQLFPGLAVRG